MRQFGSIVELFDGSELDGVDALPEATRRVQFRHRPTDERLEHLGRLMAERPDVALRAYGDQSGDLEYLRFFPGLRSFSIDAGFETSTPLDGLRHAPLLESVAIGRTRRAVALAVLADLHALRSLWIEGPQRDVGVIGGLGSIETLTLRSITLPDLGLLTSLKKLASFTLHLGGTTDLGLLPELRRLERLEIWHVRGLANVTPIERTLSLETLFLQALPQIREIPDLHRLTRLERVTLHTMKGITDLSPLAAAPALTTLSLVAMRHLPPEALMPLVGHPTLRRGLWNIGSMRKSYQAQDILPIEPEPYGYQAWRAGVPYREVLRDWMQHVRKAPVEADRTTPGG